jgi:hypothetical protein
MNSSKYFFTTSFKILLFISLPFIVIAKKKGNTDDKQPTLKSSTLSLKWTKGKTGWKLNELLVMKDNKWTKTTAPDAEYLVLFSAEKPDTTPLPVYTTKGDKINFPEPVFKSVASNYKENTSSVPLNQAGQPEFFYPKNVKKNPDGSLNFIAESNRTLIKSSWNIDHKYSSDIIVTISLTAKADGYYSIASPSLSTITEDELSWGIIPGIFQGATVEKDFVKAFVYGHGIPDKPVIVRERTAFQ